jgi:hypothetical protein
MMKNKFKISLIGACFIADEYLEIFSSKKILLKNKSNLPNYLDTSKFYYPLINFFLKKWQINFLKTIKGSIS